MVNIGIYLEQIKDWIWGPPLLLLILGVGCYFTFLLRGFQFRYLFYAIKQIYRVQKKESRGDIKPYESLMTTLSGAIGTGAIVGVSTGLVIGGVGALFWMWITALFGMATKYAESLLAIMYRQEDAKGEMIGGPMEYIERGYKSKSLAVLFAFFGVFAAIGTGNLVQSNSIAEAVHGALNINPWVTGSVIAFATACVVVGGIKTLGHVAGVLVPVMAILYTSASLYIILSHYDQIPFVLWTIVEAAFNPSAVVGGVGGITLIMVIQQGVSRSVFSNEAGLGISSIAAAAAKTDLPGRQAMINMTGALVSTVIICTLTAFVIILSGSMGARDEQGSLINGAKLAIRAFESGIVGGGYIVTLGLIMFAFTTIIAWGYYGEKCCEYLLGEKWVVPFRIIYSLMVVPGAAIHLEIVWHFADICNGLLAIPNLLALLGLAKVIVNETKAFVEVIKREERSR